MVSGDRFECNCGYRWISRKGWGEPSICPKCKSYYINNISEEVRLENARKVIERRKKQEAERKRKEKEDRRRKLEKEKRKKEAERKRKDFEKKQRAKGLIKYGEEWIPEKKFKKIKKRNKILFICGGLLIILFYIFIGSLLFSSNDVEITEQDNQANISLNLIDNESVETQKEIIEIPTNLVDNKSNSDYSNESDYIETSSSEYFNPYKTEFSINSKTDNYQNTEIYLEKGNRAIIWASGSVIWDSNTNQDSNPDGIEEISSNDEFLCPYKTPFSLVLKSGPECYFVGNYNVIKQEEFSSFLKLGFNDYYFEDNEGQFNVEVEILNESTKTENPNEIYNLDNRLEFEDESITLDLDYNKVFNVFSLSFWAKPDKTDNINVQTNQGGKTFLVQRYLFYPSMPNYPDSNNAGMGIALGTNGIQVFEQGQKDFPSILVYSGNLSDWNHFTITYKEGIPNLYIDGNFAKRGFKSTKTTIYAPTLIGEFFSGEVHKIHIFNKELSEEEIKGIYIQEKNKVN